jgi:hypothetical protein
MSDVLIQIIVMCICVLIFFVELILNLIFGKYRNWGGNNDK